MLVASFATMATAVSVMPTALASYETEETAVSYTIDVTGVELPVNLGSLDYPYNAARLGLTGSCDLELTLNEAGAASDFNVSSCSNAAFEQAAREFASTLSFDRSNGDEVRALTVVWKYAS